MSVYPAHPRYTLSYMQLRLPRVTSSRGIRSYEPCTANINLQLSTVLNNTQQIERSLHARPPLCVAGRPQKVNFMICCNSACPCQLHEALLFSVERAISDVLSNCVRSFLDSNLQIR